MHFAIWIDAKHNKHPTVPSACKKIKQMCRCAQVLKVQHAEVQVHQAVPQYLKKNPMETETNKNAGVAQETIPVKI